MADHSHPRGQSFETFLWCSNKNSILISPKKYVVCIWPDYCSVLHISNVLTLHAMNFFRTTKRDCCSFHPPPNLKTKQLCVSQHQELLSTHPRPPTLCAHILTFALFLPSICAEERCINSILTSLSLLPQVMFHLTTGSFLLVSTGPTGSLLTFNTWMSWTRSSATVETIFPLKGKKGKRSCS